MPEVSPRLDQRRGGLEEVQGPGSRWPVTLKPLTIFHHFSIFFLKNHLPELAFLLRLPVQLFASLITWAFENFSKSQVDETDGPSTAVHTLRQIDSRFEESWKEGRGWTTDRTCPDCLVVCHGSKVGTAN